MWYQVGSKLMFAISYGDQHQYFIVFIVSCQVLPFFLGVQGRRQGVVCISSPEEKIELELFCGNFEKATWVAWERMLTLC